MKVLAFILAIIGVGGASAVAAPPTPSYVAPPSSVVAAPVAARDAFVRPPRMQHTVVVVKPAAAPVKAAKPAVKKTTPTKKTSTVKKTVVRTPSSSSGCGASCQWRRGAAGWLGYPAWVEAFGRCVSKHESWSPHMWTAENPISSASGGFQFIDGTFAAWLGRAGISGNRHAAYNSPVIQVRVFAYAVTHGAKKAWHGTNCPGT